MNRIYRIVFNRSTGHRQAVSETARGTSGGSAATMATASALALAGLLMMPLTVQAADVYWGSGFSGYWFQPANWIGGVVPGAADNATIGNGTGAQLYGLGADAKVQYFELGNGAESSLTIFDRATLTMGLGVLGSYNRANINISGTGSMLRSTGLLRLGARDYGLMNLSAGASVSSGALSMGVAATGVGAINMTGQGTSLNTGSSLIVGESGRGYLDVTNASSVTSGSATVGANGGASGQVYVRQSDSRWNIAQGLVMGESAGSDGSLQVTQSGAVDIAGALVVGQSGRGNLGVFNGSLAAGETSVAQYQGGYGVLSVSGATATFQNNGNLHVGISNTLVSGGATGPAAVG
ncbi:MAG: hypothetical protein EON54_13830, partial [Alcaligenaceae bacterium]